MLWPQFVSPVNKYLGDLCHICPFFGLLCLLPCACAPRAYQDYQAAIVEGQDDREDWEARKACNYLEQAVEVNRLKERVKLIKTVPFKTF